MVHTVTTGAADHITTRMTLKTVPIMVILHQLQPRFSCHDKRQNNSFILSAIGLLKIYTTVHYGSYTMHTTILLLCVLTGVSFEH
jgi:hypothetical protein